MNTFEKLDKGKLLEIATMLGLGKTPIKGQKNIFKNINVQFALGFLK